MNRTFSRAGSYFRYSSDCPASRCGRPIYAGMNTDRLIIVIGAALLVAIVVVWLLRGM